MRVVVLLAAGVCALLAQVPSPEKLFENAVAAQRRGDDKTAIRIYEQLARRTPASVEVRANYGAALARQGRFDEAIEQYRAAIANDKTNPNLKLNLALAYYKKGSFPDAVSLLKPLQAARPEDPQIALLLADSYAHLGREAEVISLLTPIEARAPAELGIAWMLGSALIRTGRVQDGLKKVEQVARAGHSAEAHLLAGQTCLKLNDFERARDHADAAKRLNPQLAGVARLRGIALSNLGDNPGAIAELRNAIALDADDFEAHLNLGAILFTERQLEESRRELDRALELNAGSALARYQMGRLDRTEGKLDSALRNLEQVVKQEPSWAQAHIELSALYFRLNRPEDGERERALYEKLNEKPAPSR